MNARRWLAGGFCVAVVAAAAWIGGGMRAEPEKETPPKEVAPGVHRLPGQPAGYVLTSGEHALLIDAPNPAAVVQKLGIKKIEAVLLTHHHRDSCAAAADYLAQNIPVRAAKASALWLTTEGVTKYWRESLPLRTSRTAYLVVAEGLKDLRCDLEDGQTITWRDWKIEVIASPGHTQDHLAFAARKGVDGPLLLFCGDAMSAPGKMWSPYTTDWDHWTNAGLKPASESLRKLAARKPDILLPAHGEILDREAAGALIKTAEAVEEMSFLKSFERFTKQRLGNAPQYRFLAKEQAESNGSRPWSQVSPHLWLTGNTFVLLSKDGPILVFDPWDPHSAKQIPKLKEDQKLGAMEIVLFSHAHYDHYDGIYSIFDREKPKVWALDYVAEPLREPFRLRAPFLDERPIVFDRLFKDGEIATWREYRLKFHYLPGQTDFTMGVETVIDGKRCFFTADNWFHQDQFSGSGGWMGLNRSHPHLYAASAQKVLDAKPEWVLAEHGGAFEFNAEDFRRRVEWGKVSAKAADAMCPSGNLLHDWDPHRVRVEPVLVRAKPGEEIRATLVVSNPLKETKTIRVTLQGRSLANDKSFDVKLDGKEVREPFVLKLGQDVAAGRHIFPVQASADGIIDPSDAFVAIEVRK